MKLFLATVFNSATKARYRVIVEADTKPQVFDVVQCLQGDYILETVREITRVEYVCNLWSLDETTV